MSNQIVDYMRAGYPLLYLRTGEMERAFNDVVSSIKNCPELGDVFEVFQWRITTGLIRYVQSSEDQESLARDFAGSVNYAIYGENGSADPDKVYVFHNPRDFMKDPGARQTLRDAADVLSKVGSHIICIGCDAEFAPEIRDVITVIDYELPTKQQLKQLFATTVEAYGSRLVSNVDNNLLELAAENATGLSYYKAENAVGLSIARKGTLDIEMIRSEKEVAVRQTGVLEYVPANESLDTLGGFDVLKEHVIKRRRYFEDRESAERFGLRPPKGIMLVGLAGCGKSLSGKVVANALNLPLYKFNVGAVFKGIVGQSEEAIRNALKLAEAVSPCVLLFDEMEKGLAGAESSGKTDSGVTSRVIAQLLSWMQETTAPIYKLATCNTIRNLDAALFRRGRWDCVFAVDLPTEEERSEIYSIHLKKRGRNPNDFAVQTLALESGDFVGAEIESVVDEALYLAFDAGRELETEDLLTVARTVVPIAKTDKEEISSFRGWMSERATNVSSSRKGGNQNGNGSRKIRFDNEL